MRWVIGLVTLAATPALAASPLCADSEPIRMTAADAPGPAQAPPIPVDKPNQGAAKAPLPPGLAPMPFVQHVAEAGATILDLGTSHGLHMMAARRGADFRVFSVLPDGKAAVQGAPIELSMQQLMTIAKGSVTELGTRLGFDGYFVRSGPEFQVFYAAPDGQVVIPGILRDAEGKDITRQQVANIPGAIPTVEVAGPPVAGTPIAAAAFGPTIATAETLAALEKADYGSIGAASAPQLFMLIDPQCIYSVRSFQQLRGFAVAGKIRLSVVPLSILDYEDQGQSSRSALALLSKLVGLAAGHDIDQQDCAQAQLALAQIRNAPVGQAVAWKSSTGSYGSFTPTSAEYSGPDGTFCRKVNQQAAINGHEATDSVGVTCRTPDGDYRTVSAQQT